MKTSIRTKIILLGAILSILAMGIALMVSYFSSKSALSKQLDLAVQNTMQDLHDTFYDDLFKEEYIDATKSVKEYVLEKYNEKPDLPAFESVEEEKKYLTSIYAFMYYIYPDFQGFIMYAGLAEFTKKYIALRSVFQSEKVLSGGNTCYIAFYDQERERLVYLLDYSFGKLDLLNEERFPGSYETNMAKPSDDYTQISTYSSGKVITKSLPIYEIEDSQPVGEPIAYVFFEYDYSGPQEQVNKSTLINFATLGSVALMLIILYALVSHFLIVRNLKKLSSSTLAFTRALNNGEEIKSINPNVKSKDELELLSKSFVSMEDEIINYVDVIKKEAETKERMNAELGVASRIQLEALPNTCYDDNVVSIRSFIQSAKEVGGDFYDYFYLDGTHLAFIISDVTGKGIPASLFMMRAKELIKSKLLSTNDIEQVCFDVNNSLLANNKEALFVTSFIGVLDLEKEELLFVNAGHERPFIIANGEVKQLQCNANFVLGGVNDFKYVSEKIPFSKDTTIFLHTDGLNESINSEREEFGYFRILESLQKSIDSSLDEKIEILNKDLSTFCGLVEPFDDETLLFINTPNRCIDEKYTKPTYDIIGEITNKFNDKFSFLSTKVKSEFGIIFDEILNNVVSYEKPDELVVEVKINTNKDDIILTITSNGEEFNPLDKADKYLTEYSDDLKVGGFGLTIVKNLSNNIQYYRKNKKNVLVLTKHIK